MKIHRFYLKETTIEGSGNLDVGKQIKIFDEEVLHQMKNVFRLKAGDKVIFFDGSIFQKSEGHFFGKDFQCVAKIVSKKEGVFDVTEVNEIPLPEKELHVFLACIRKERFEWAVEKCTEIGVSSITPILTSRSEHTHLNISRLQKIAIEASEQCGRSDVPHIASAQSLELLVESLDTNSEILVAHFGGEKVTDLFSNHKLIAKSYKLFIGPEGGWTDEELDFFKSKNVKFISLGQNTLRAETAAVLGSASLLN